MNPASSILLTDLYQLTMLEGYYRQGMRDIAVFEFFVRRLPERRNYLVAAGLQQALDYLENLKFTSEEIAWLHTTQRFSQDFLQYLSALRFTGDVYAMPEGTVFFSNEPILRVVAPLPEAQLVESRLINLLHFQTMIASKAARCVLVAPDKLLVDFGMRRAHGAEAGLLAARAGYLAGLHGTATVLAGAQFGIPIFGTMAHSFVQAHDAELLAFEHFAYAQPDNVVLLIDTYDTEAAANKVVSLKPHLAKVGIKIKAVRIDSGDLAEHAHKVRQILDEGGCQEITIFASSSLDEYAVQKLLQAGAPIDGFGIGTYLDASADQPYLDCAYKLQEYAGRPRRKRSEHKATLPGRKQVYRQFSADGSLSYDVLTLEDDVQPGIPLLLPVMYKGKLLRQDESLDEIRRRVVQQLQSLAMPLRDINEQHDYSVRISDCLQDMANKFDNNSN